MLRSARVYAGSCILVCPSGSPWNDPSTGGVSSLPPCGRAGRSGSCRDQLNESEMSSIDQDRISRVGDLFEREPVQWGLRGDPYVWAAMRDKLADVLLPSDWFDLRSLLYATFNDVVGVELDETELETVFREEFAAGGMSSGTVDVLTWRDRLIPILIDRSRLR